MKQIELKMDDATVEDLNGHGAYLFGFVASRGADNEARPVVWFKTNKFSAQTQIDFLGTYSAYTSFTDIEVGEQVTPADSKKILPGQTLNVAQNGICTINTKGIPGIISIYNTVDQELRCGLSADGNFSNSATCIYALHGKNTVTIEPTAKIILFFSTTPDHQGQIIEELYSGGTTKPGALIDLAKVPDKAIVSFQSNQGWAPEPWLETIPSNANLVPYIIESDNPSHIAPPPGHAPSRTEITLKNEGLFVMKFKVVWTNKNGQSGASGWTDTYPINQSRTIVLNTLNIPNGAMVKPIVKAILGETNSSAPPIQFFEYAPRIATFKEDKYRVSGTTLSVKIQKS